MSENKEYITRLESDGTVNISVEVVCSIAALAASECEGVCGLLKNKSSELAELLGRKSLSEGVRLTVLDDESFSLDCNVMIECGEKIPEVAAAVQEAVMSAVESTTGVKVSAVNVNICGMAMPKKSV